MALAFATISFLLGSCKVNAEGNFISPSQFTFHFYPNGESRTAANCLYNTCTFMSGNDTTTIRSRGGYWSNYNTTHSFNGVTLVMFNGAIISTGNTSIKNISFLTNPCYFTQTTEFSYDDYSHNRQYNTFSAYCPVSNTDNIGSLSIGPNVQIVDISLTDGINAVSYSLSKIKIVQDTWGTEIIRLLNENNGYWATNQGILTRLETILRQQLTNEDIINGYLSTIQGLLTNSNNQAHQDAQQAHQDAQAQKDATDNINDSINDSSTDDPSDDLDDMKENEASNSVISDLLLLPLNMFQRILNSINGSCSSFNLGSLYGSNLTLPCIDIPSVIGSSLWGIIDILFSGIFVLSIRKKFVDIFQNITSLKDRGNELE